MTTPSREMTISKLAQGAGVGVETVRYYQRRGLMPVPRAAYDASYRHYDGEHLRRLKFIRRAQAAGFTLEEIRELLTLDPMTQRSRVRALASERLTALDRQQAEIEAARAALGRLVATCAKSGQGPCPIIEAFDVSR